MYADIKLQHKIRDIILIIIRHIIILYYIVCIIIFYAYIILLCIMLARENDKGAAVDLRSLAAKFNLQAAIYITP